MFSIVSLIELSLNNEKYTFILSSKEFYSNQSNKDFNSS